MAKNVVEISQVKQESTHPIRVAAYARVSCGKDTMLHSLAAQIDYYRHLILSNIGWEFAGVYADEAKTGTKEDRAQFQELLGQCRAGAVDMVITKSISRFARNTVTLLKTVRELKNLGVDVFFEEQNIHTISAEGEIMLTLLASFAQAESLSCSENCKWRIRSGYEEGRPSNFRALGYRLVDGDVVVVPEEVETVQRIFSLYLQGYGTQRIANTMNEEGWPTVYGGRWGASAIANILDNEKYCGDLLLQKSFIGDHISKKPRKNTGQLPKYFIKDDHEAIIDRNDFERVILQRKERSKNKGQWSEKSVLTGMVRCACCGKNYRRKTTAGGAKWCCATYNTRGKRYCPDSKMIPEDTLHTAICEVLGMDEYDEAQVLRDIDQIDACKDNLIRFHFKDGTTTEYVWADRSRSESWTPEMKEQARAKAIRRNRHG